MKDAYIHLGITSGATIEDIEAAYENKKRLFDPSRFPDGSPEQEEARKMTTTIELAYHFAVASYYAPQRKEPSTHAPFSFDSSRASVVYPKKAQPAGQKIFFASCIFLALLLGGYGLFRFGRFAAPPAPAVQRSPKEKPPLQEGGADLALPELAAKVLPSTVWIVVSRNDGGKSSGSGFFVTENGDILTNYHVVEDAYEIAVKQYEGEPFFALLKGTDKNKDMALIAMREPRKTIPLALSGSLPRQGEPVMAVGNPRQLEQTVSSGIVSAIREVGGVQHIQITAPLSSGSSGGAVVNMRSEVVGMSTWLNPEGQNLNFAIASPFLSRFVDDTKDLKPRDLKPRDLKPREAPKAAQKAPVPRRSPKAAPPPAVSGVSLPTQNGFMGHKWGSSPSSLKKRLPQLEAIDRRTMSDVYSTLDVVSAFESKVKFYVTYSFYKNQLYVVSFLLEKDEPKDRVQDIYDDLVRLYGVEGEELEGLSSVREGYFWRNGNLVTILSIGSDDYFKVEFIHWPIMEKNLQDG